VKLIQVPFELIINKQKYKSEVMYLYIHLKMVCKNENVNIYAKKLLKNLNWSNNRRLKKYLFILKQNDYLSYDFENIPIHNTLNITLRKIDNKVKKELYVTVDTDTINKIKNCTNNINIDNKVLNLQEQALRLFYYYEKCYNYKEGKAYPSFANISNDIGIRPEYITILNNIFEQNKIVKIKKGKYYTDDDGFAKRERNNYIPICKNR